MRTVITRIVGLVALLGLAACFPVERTTDQIERTSQGRTTYRGEAHGYQFFRNEAYQCGRNGSFTFLIIEPAGANGAEAPLWVYLHGGGVGYYDDEDGTYVGARESHNDEETVEDLTKRVRANVEYPDGRDKDTTLGRRLDEGYRVLVPSMCDHDLRAGMGTPYPNNPNGLGPDGGGVNGLQADLAALDYTIARRPTGLVFVHGTSAGSVGAWALTYSLDQEGTDVTGTVLDSYFIGPRLDELFAAGVTPLQISDPDFDPAQVIEKVGFFTDHAYVEDEIAAGFRAVPLFAVTGGADPTCAGALPPIAAAVSAGYTNNCDYWQGGVEDAIAAQPSSPHDSYVLPGGPHVPSVGPYPQVHDRIDTWLDGILATDPAPPFAG